MACPISLCTRYVSHSMNLSLWLQASVRQRQGMFVYIIITD